MFNMNNFLSAFPEERFPLENCTNLNHPPPCTSCACSWQPAQCCCVTQRAGPQCWSPFSQLPLTDFVKTCLTTSILLSFTVFTAVWFCVCFFSLFLYPFHSLVFCFASILPSLPPSLPSNLHAYIPPCPPGSGCSSSSAAVLAKNRCPRNTSPVREKEWDRERERKRGSTWRQIRWTVGSAGAVWKCGIPFRDLKSCVAKLKDFVFLQHLGLLIWFIYLFISHI